MIEVKPNTEPVERVTPLKPSEALRLGRVLYPIHTWGVMSFDLPNGDTAMCAYAAMCAGGAGSIHDVVEQLIQLRAECPAGGCFHSDHSMPMDGTSLVIHLNDTHRWPSSKIASFLEENGL